MSKDDPRDYEVGYCRPPRQTRFQKGQSGNPGGRPKGNHVPPALPSLYPTRSLIREDAKRPVILREGEHKTSISTTGAVLRSLAKSAMEGRPLAARTYLQLQVAEDERHAAEREKTFQIFEKYVARMRESIERARARGVEPPDPVPHPDDIVFDAYERTVRFIGPTSKEAADHARRVRDLSHLVWDLAFYHDEAMEPAEDFGESRIGFWRACYFALQIQLPARLRGCPHQFEEPIVCRTRRRFLEWEAQLEARCAAFDFPFYKKWTLSATWTLRELELYP